MDTSNCDAAVHSILSNYLARSEVLCVSFGSIMEGKKGSAGERERERETQLPVPLLLDVVVVDLRPSGTEGHLHLPILSVQSESLNREGPL